MTQLAPLQQSAEAVQMAPMPWHTTGAPQTPFVQICEQQLAENAQVPPFALHNGPASTAPPSVVPPSGDTPPSPPVSVKGRHTPAMQNAPPQQLASVAHVAPRGAQVLVVQRKMPPSPGRQSAPLQHWSRNWQMSPLAMQQPAWPV